MIYVIDRELTRELIVSKGKGKRTKKLETMLILIAENVSVKMNTIYDYDLKYDCKMHATLHILVNWKKFNHYKYDKSLPFITELIKRSMAESYNIQIHYSYADYKKMNIVRYDFSGNSFDLE